MAATRSGPPLGTESLAGAPNAFQEILVLVDGSDAGWLGLEQALELVSPLEGAIHGLVIVEEKAGQPTPAGGPEEGEAAYRRCEEQVQAELQQRCQERGVRCSSTVRRGRPAEVLHQLDLPADLIGLGYGGQEEEGFLADIAGIIQRSSRPVLVAIHHPRAIGRLLVAYDGGPASHQAVEMAAQVARPLGIPVDVLSVQERDEDTALLLRQAGRILARAGVEADFVQRQGTTSDQIVAVARERESDLILVGMYQHGHLRRTLFGCTLDNLLLKTTRPLLVCGRGHEF